MSNKCTHYEWVKICVICGKVIDDSTPHEERQADCNDGAIGGGGKQPFSASDGGGKRPFSPSVESTSATETATKQWYYG